MSDLVDTFITRGDLAHLALFLWAAAASFTVLLLLRELSAASRRFDDFVRELALFNRRADGASGRADGAPGRGIHSPRRAAAHDRDCD